MKKTMILVSAIVALAMGTMWVSCNSNAPVEGCTCSVYENGVKQEGGDRYYPIELMSKYYNASTCNELTSALNKGWIEQGTPWWSQKCF